MKIKSITISNFGPFYGAHTLALDPCVTVLTGPNDCGKTILLDALACTASHQATTERRINITRAGEVPGNRLSDSQMSAEMVFEVSQQCIEMKALATNFKPGDVVTAKRLLGRQSTLVITKIHRDGKRSGAGGDFLKWDLLRLPGETFRQIIPLKSKNAVERAFLEIGFGPKFDDLDNKVPIRWPDKLREAEEKLTQEIRRLLPPTMPMEIRLADGAPQNPGAVRISLVDAVGEIIGTDDRGAGIGKILGFVGPLVLALRKPESPLLILIDEPETSLHADLQHKLRALLEEIGKMPMCQVVYATHSPSMINNMRPEAIRLLIRDKTGEFPTSRIKNDPFNKSFAAVRSALGVTPADSLLYAPVTVVVEGKTEIYCLPRLLQKLMEGSIAGFNGVGDILDQIHFLDGEGDSVEFLVRLAKSQNVKVVVFLDEEKRPKKGEEKLASDHPDVPVIKLDAGKDIEQLVPRDIYFQAVATCCAENSPPDAGTTITPEAFDNWLASQKQGIKDKMFGGQVQDWLADTLSASVPPKHKIMGKTIDLCPPEKIASEKLRQLVGAIRNALNPPPTQTP